MKFIKLTILNGGKTTINCSKIAYVTKRITRHNTDGGTMITGSFKDDGDYILVKETPEEIDRLLGIEEPEVKIITKILTCKSCIGYVAFQSEKGCPECVNGSMFEKTPF